MTQDSPYLDPNSGAVAQPGSAIYRGEAAEAEARAAEAAAAEEALEDTQGLDMEAVAHDDDPGEDEPTTEGELEDEPAPEGEGDDDEEDEEASAPAKSASKGDWVDFAVSQGADREEAEDSTKEQLIEAYGA